MATAVQLAQTKFLMAGGWMEFGLNKHRESGFLPSEYTYHEYPRMISFSRGKEIVRKSTKTCEKETITWEEEVEQFDRIVVNSEEEEERVLSGGKTSMQLEDERLGLLNRCSAMSIPADPSWSAVRLRRLLGDALDAPAPANKEQQLEAELASLRKMAAMQAEIAALKAQLAGSMEVQVNDLDDMRQELGALGIVVDKRWGELRLRQELEKATAPERTA